MSKGWIPVRDLQPGDRLVDPKGSDVDVVAVTATGETATVYNFNVDELHTYHVQAGETWIRVHNTCNTTAGQLQKKFKHAIDFGVEGNYSKANATKFDEAIQAHVDAPGTQAIQGTYRGQPVVHHVDPNTGLNVMTTPQNDFISGWKLKPEQLKNVLSHGGLGGS